MYSMYIMYRGMCRSSGGSVASMETADSPKAGGRRYFLTHEKMIKNR